MNRVIIAALLLVAISISGCSSGSNSPNGPEAVDLGTAGNFAILAKSAISTVPASAITGDIGISPAAASFITGFSPLVVDGLGAFATSSQITGKAYASDYAEPTPTNLTTAVGDMMLAYDDAAGRVDADFTELSGGDISGKTLEPGLYKWGTGVSITTDVTLSGSSSDVWIFQVAGNITQAAGASVLLSGGALPGNIYWQVAGAVDIGVGAHMEGNILCATAITLLTGASANGRLLAQTAVALDANVIVKPNP